MPGTPYREHGLDYYKAGKLLVCLVGIIVGVMLLLYLLYGAAIYTGKKTRYAPGYTEAGFHAISANATIEDVQASLGKPLKTIDYQDRFRQLYYTIPDPKGSGSYEIRMLVVDLGSGKVIHRVEETHWD